MEAEEAAAVRAGQEGAVAEEVAEGTSFCASGWGGWLCCSSTAATLSTLVLGSFVTSLDALSPFMI